MAMLNDKSIGSVIQNLKDAGCDAQCIEQFLSLGEEGKTLEQLELLSAHRRQLLDKVHQEEKRIDCLADLVYQIQKKKSAV